LLSKPLPVEEYHVNVPDDNLTASRLPNRPSRSCGLGTAREKAPN
jgi:hypothetical protein